MFSTVAQLRANLPFTAKDPFAVTMTNVWVQERIDESDLWIQDRLFNLLGQILPPYPSPVVRLSQYAACESALITAWSTARIGDAKDADYWAKKKDQQLLDILQGRVRTTTMPSPEIKGNKTDPNWKPAFGYGEYGERTDGTDPEDTTDPYEQREDV